MEAIAEQLRISFMWKAPEGTGMIFVVAFVMFTSAGYPMVTAEVFNYWKQRILNKRLVLSMLSNVAIYLPTMFTTSISLVILHTIAEALARAGWVLNLDLSTPATLILSLLVADFLYYWLHRMNHFIHILWEAAHSVHHSAEHFDQSVGLRVSFVENFIFPFAFAPALALGFSPELTLSCFLIVLAYQQWLHTELFGKIPIFDALFNSPSNHRVHHGRNELYLDKNFGGILIIWDKIFGTYQRETEKVEYGIVDRVKTVNPIVALLIGFTRMNRKPYQSHLTD